MRAWFYNLLWLALMCAVGSIISRAQENRALELRGKGDFVELPAGAPAGLTATTVEAWFNFQKLGPGNKRILNYGVAWHDISIYVRDGAIWMAAPEGQDNFFQVSSRAILETNTWYHVAATYGPDGMKLYLNGWLIGSEAHLGAFERPPAGSLFRIGETVSVNDGSSDVHGLIDEVRIWKRQLAENDIRANMHRRLNGTEPDLAALWNFDDGTAIDRGPNHWDGSLRGNANCVRAEIPAQVGIGQVYLDARVRNAQRGQAGSAVLEVFSGTNLALAKFSRDGIFKVILSANNAFELRATTLDAQITERATIKPGSQASIYLDLPPARASTKTTNQFAAALNSVLLRDPYALEKIDSAVALPLAGLLRESEEKLLTLFESPDANRRRFLAVFLERFDHSTLPIVVALAKARHDADDLVRGLAQRSLQALPVPKEFEAVYTKRDTATSLLFAGLLVPMALIHFFIFLVYPPVRTNLYFSIFAAAGAVMLYLLGQGSDDSAWARIAMLAFTGAGLLVLYSLFSKRLPRFILGLLGAAIIALAWKNHDISKFSSIQLGMDSAAINFQLGTVSALALSYVALICGWLDMLRVVVLSIWRRQEGSLLVGAGYFIMTAAMVVRFFLYLLLFTGKISADTFANYIIYFPHVGAAGFVICGSIYLAKTAARGLAEVNTAKIEIEKKNAELTAARDLALSANKAKSQFLANMSHELRTPLNAIIGYSELVAEIAQDEGHDAYVPDLEKIRTAAKHQLMLVNDILDLSKIEAGRMALSIEEFDVKSMINEIQSVVAPLVAKNRNRLEIHFAPEIGKIRADQMKVRQILFNLLSNAAKFTEDGLITLRAAPARIGEASAVELAVSDTGIGMTAEQTARLFQAFTQAETTIHQKYGGSGLGLVISRRFCEMMGGSLTVSSEFGKGSTFQALLPTQVKAPVTT